ncbi:hypothetical protein PQ455_18030 [Sphingomonas naphthae]|uniref:Polysaccharide biosynthesis protein n=1 Tax=Sphingomonas naphthae TaxID=1813468 RepID=A0ABY7TM57_9SPHN|nr:hypothetical protein [Sphingomonas naphthae]WCT73480.1 hypothetical protein PQ455_18030 [Sphingomonas naphthae]
MSIARRMLSGNLAGLASIGINLGGQIALVPIFLQHWSAAQYGVWLGLVTALAMIQIADNAHLDYLGFECMKLPSGDRAQRSQILWDTLPALGLSAIAELILLASLLLSPLTAALFSLSAGSADLPVLQLALGGLALLWYVVQFPVQLGGRVLASIGHYPKTAWWYVVNQSAQAFAPAIAVIFGGGLAEAALAYAGGVLLVQIVCGAHYARVARAEGLELRRPNAGAGIARLGGGMMLGFGSLLENMQLAGFRLILLPFLGPVRLVQFSTMRTVANVVQQGLIVLVNPSIPELMRFVGDRDATRARMVMTGMIYVAVLAMCPGFVLLQAVVRPLFRVWTLGKVAFDPLAFVALSASVLFMGLAQSSRAIARGNNLVGTQTGASFLSGVILLGLTFLTAPRIGLFGVAISVATAEAVRSGLFVLAARRWACRNDFVFPLRPLLLATGCVGITIAVMVAIALLPRLGLLLAGLYVPLWGAMNVAFWGTIDEAEREGLRRMAGKLTRRFGRGGRPVIE